MTAALDSGTFLPSAPPLGLPAGPAALQPPAPAHRTVDVRAAYHDFVLGGNHPCVMAQTIFRDDAAVVREYEALACPYSATRILADLRAYVGEYDPSDPRFVTFMAAFPGEPLLDEPAFERLLWTLLQNLHDADPAPWDPRVSSDPDSDNFSFSLHGQAFYIVGLHPGSSRLARRAPCATVVFNLHDQFERLRGMGAYQRVRNRIRRRDLKLQGSNNPMLEDFGARSEARQYAGRAVGDDWACPFLAKAPPVSQGDTGASAAASAASPAASSVVPSRP